MALIEHVQAESWPELSRVIDEYFSHYDSYIFRGQADAQWRLDPTINRVLDGMYIKQADKEQALVSHLRNFKENIRGRVAFDLSGVSPEEIWSLGQHFGLSTPLLDWSLSPYVALFFSLFGPCESGERVLWAIVRGDIEAINHAKGESQRGVEIVNPMSHFNDRLVSQRGLFLYVPIGVNLEEWVATGEVEDWVTMYKITYPDSIRNDALSALDIRNVNHLSLFPDISGAAQYANYKMEAEPYLGRSRESHPWAG